MPVTRAAQAVGVAIGTTKAVSGALNRLGQDLRHRRQGAPVVPSQDPQATAESDVPAAPAAPEDQELLVTPPQEPPVDVVGQALASEAAGAQEGNGRATEPSASSRDEGHGDAGLQRAELEEWADEIVEGLNQDSPAGDVDVATPVGTTGADVGFNPDTAEADLQQPGTEPLLDPSLTKSVKSEADTLGRASDPDKG
jgi:hypothetical protein